MKNTYELIINQGTRAARPVLAAFSHNKGIELHIKKKGAVIAVSTRAEKDTEAIFAGRDNLFADALKKVMLLYLIQYGCGLKIRTARLLCNQAEIFRWDSKTAGGPLIYAMNSGNLRLPFSENWQAPEVLSAIVSTSKSAYNGWFTALHALTVAKSDRYEIERFLYYWMAMNGLYNYAAMLEKKRSGSSYGTDRAKHILFLKGYGHEIFEVDVTGIPKNKRDNERKRLSKRICEKTEAVLKRIPEADIEPFCAACIGNDLENPYVRQVISAVSKVTDSLEDIHSFMVIWFPYQLRCNTFHSEAALPTFCFAEEDRLKVLRVVNRLLDRYLTEELPKWMRREEEQK